MSRRLGSLLAAVFLVAAAGSAASVDPQMRAVERIRGRRFLHPVDVVTLDRAELPKRLREQMEKSLAYPVEDWVTVLRALQLIDPETKDPLPTLIELYESQVLAYYDPLGHTYYAIRQLPAAVPANTPRALLEEGVAVHELTHALQDQLFDAGKRDFELRDDIDAGLAYHALLEGEASLVMFAQMLAKSGADFDMMVKNDLMLNTLMAAAAADKSMDGSAPRYFVESLKFPYLDGLRFVIEAYRRGGWARLDEVHAHPPRSTREILHPQEYFEHHRERPPFDGKPHGATAGAHVLSVEHLGEFHWGFLAGKENARGWVDDRVTITQDERCNPSVLVETKWESPERAKAFRDAYVAFLEKRNVAPWVTGDGTTVNVTYTP